MKWSQGRVDSNGVQDRSREHLGSTDIMIMRVRQKLLEAATALRDEGVEPPCVATPTAYSQRSGWTILPEGVDYFDGLRELREGFIGTAVPAPARTLR